MAEVRPGDRPAQEAGPDPEELLDRFEGAWRRGQPIALGEMLRLARGLPNEAARRDFCDGLLGIDLEYRWRRRQGTREPAGPCLDDYFRNHPELGRLDQVSCDLVGSEYRVRQRWGDRPSHSEFLNRFPRQGAALEQALRDIDEQLAADASCSTVPAKPAEPRLSASPITVPMLIDVLSRKNILNQRQLAEHGCAAALDPRTWARGLLERGWLTPYQVNQLLLGRGADLILGHYLLLERLGEGGAGQVFKARHLKLNRVVAVKLLRRELLADAEVVGRFYREIQVASQLGHPNVVHAYDAGPVGALHFLAMEYVEGTDLGKLVKQGGPLPVEQACAYIRQAALGLQHAHERGLVHRDIKPHNLILSLKEGLIKVTDLGLARLARPANAEATAALTCVVQSTGTLTPENAALIGTLDYLSPEQALDFHNADIRSDIYSLGCTFYYLLAGQPPFAGATLAEKLLRHQQAEPPELKRFRDDVPATVLAVLRRMLAKSPAERYQTPEEVAKALAPGGKLPPAVAAPRSRRRAYLVALVGTALLLAIVYSLWRPTNPPNPSEAARAYRQVCARLDDGALPPLQKAQAILRFRMAHPGTEEARQAAARFMLLRQPADELKDPPYPDGFPDVWKKNGLVVAIPYEKLTAVSALQFSPDGALLAVAVENDIRLWDVTRGQERRRLKGHVLPVRSLVFSPGGELLASGEAGDQGKAWLWDVRSGEGRELPIRGAAFALAFSSDGKTLASAERLCYLYDVPSGKPRQLALDHIAVINSLAFTADGRTLVVAGTSQAGNDLLLLCDMESNQKVSIKGVSLYAGPCVVVDRKIRRVGPSGSGWGLFECEVPTDWMAGPSGSLSLAEFKPRVPAAAYYLSCSLDGKVIFSANPDGFYRYQTFKENFTSLPGAGERAHALAPDGRHIAVWKATTGPVAILRLAPIPR